jgi:hypothetical protein
MPYSMRLVERPLLHPYFYPYNSGAPHRLSGRGGNTVRVRSTEVELTDEGRGSTRSPRTQCLFRARHLLPANRSLAPGDGPSTQQCATATECQTGYWSRRCCHSKTMFRCSRAESAMSVNALRAKVLRSLSSYVASDRSSTSRQPMHIRGTASSEKSSRSRNEHNGSCAMRRLTPVRRAHSASGLLFVTASTLVPGPRSPLVSRYGALGNRVSDPAWIPRSLPSTDVRSHPSAQRSPGQSPPTSTRVHRFGPSRPFQAGHAGSIPVTRSRDSAGFH